ncbi:MAG: hypothetical protein J6S58_10740, partial [Lentisphaeria bacterium]|nr:hypothetical protein [Lentisphaeria bacterium]
MVYLSQDSFRIFFTEKVPFTQDGKQIPSLWKKADSFCEPLDLITLRKSATKSSYAMLYDRENLYIRIRYTIPGAKDPEEWKKSYILLHFALGEVSENRTLQIMLRENSSVNCALLNGYVSQGCDPEEVTLPEIRCYTGTRCQQRSFVWESHCIIPFSALKRVAPGNGEELFFAALLSRQDLQYECISHESVLSYMDTFYADGTRWIAGSFTEDSMPPRQISAAEQMKRFYGKGMISLCPETAGSKELPYRNILGINNSPRIRMSRLASVVEKEKSLFRELGPARVRHHDAALNDSGYALIDVTRIFPLFRADHNDPENYDFGPTDLYLSYVAECGVPIEFRFGESIEHSERKFRVKPPADPEKWAQICVNIMRHYKEGWHNGMKLDIPYASVWEEPDGLLLDGPYEKYLEMYEHFARAMAKAFPEVRIGGPQSLSIKSIEELLSSCREKDLAIDFISKTIYPRNPAALAYCGKAMRKITEKHSYRDLEIFFAEWHYCPRSWSRFHPEDCLTMENAAFSLAGMICMQGVMDMAYFYLWASAGYYGLFSTVSEPYKVYYALCLYTQFIRKNGRALPVKMDCGLPG